MAVSTANKKGFFSKPTADGGTAVRDRWKAAGLLGALAACFTPLGGIIGQQASENTIDTFMPCLVPCSLLCCILFAAVFMVLMMGR